MSFSTFYLPVYDFEIGVPVSYMQRMVGFLKSTLPISFNWYI